MGFSVTNKLLTIIYSYFSLRFSILSVRSRDLNLIIIFSLFVIDKRGHLVVNKKRISEIKIGELTW